MLKITFEDNTEWFYYPENKAVISAFGTYLMKEAVDPVPGRYFTWEDRRGSTMTYHRKVKRVGTVGSS